MFKKKIPTESQLRRLRELEDIKEDYLKQFKNPIIKFLANIIRWYKVEGLVVLLIVAVVVIIVLTVSYNKTDGLRVDKIKSEIKVEKQL